MSVLACAVFCGAAEEDSRWVHPLCQPLAIDSDGPFAELADGSLMTIDAQGARVSRDEGKTWSEAQRVCEGLDGLREGREPASSSIVRTRGGALVSVYLDSTTYNFSWDRTIDQPKDDCRLEIWAIRSLDGGKTWIDRHRILAGYNPNFFGFIQTRRQTGCHGAAPGTRPGPLRGSATTSVPACSWTFGSAALRRRVLPATVAVLAAGALGGWWGL